MGLVNCEYPAWDIEAGLMAVVGASPPVLCYFPNGRTTVTHLALKFLSQKEKK